MCRKQSDWCRRRLARTEGCRPMGLVALLWSLVFVVTAHAMSLPSAPSGFAWREVPEIKAAFLVPSGWQFRRHAQGTTLALFMTP